MATSDRVERAARTLPPLERRCYRKARRYVSGTSLDEALAVVGDLHDRGMSASIDQFGEGLNDPDAEAVLALAHEGAPVMPTLQANLKRSERDAELLAEARVPVRLVQGAYLEPVDLAHPWGEQTDLAFLRLARKLHDSGVELSIATHDPVLREALLTSLEGV